jgi:hypothetical protein
MWLIVFEADSLKVLQAAVAELVGRPPATPSSLLPARRQHRHHFELRFRTSGGRTDALLGRTVFEMLKGIKSA